MSRERLWVFRPGPAPGSWTMDFHALRDGLTLAEATSGDEAFRSLGLKDVTRYPSACRLPWRRRLGGLSARIPDGCRIVARSGRAMTLRAVVRLKGDVLVYREEGILDDGRLAFRVPGAGAYRFERVAPATRGSGRPRGTGDPARPVPASSS
ncbi:MAG: hypothetical protein NZM40_04665 [Sphingomonadaceae bacterium]|uniref:hypothetical protein n=1 Tax=Thermaurantiacus sp. TaxID=2820283 RepID=UPI00298EFB87|nr:hypothetical protein [Thermaurantiacus sp.]MCS6986714.1 hypothetical protein [Sphingomonadaceae bacterium]MDW8414023.1 hypothetical protein [Thermaurantiacus sp.]